MHEKVSRSTLPDDRFGQFVPAIDPASACARKDIAAFLPRMENPLNKTRQGNRGEPQERLEPGMQQVGEIRPRLQVPVNVTVPYLLQPLLDFRSPDRTDGAAMPVLGVGEQDTATFLSPDAVVLTYLYPVDVVVDGVFECVR